ncbi:MAG: ATP-binding cassette domain-containing protein [Treponema sp.]|nr:ATP-binding cassette domain-containing protein [Treponema sp.]
MTENLLSIQNLNITLVQSEQTLLKNFSLELNSKECKGISSPTGTGKSTLLNYIAGILNKENFTISGKLQKAENLKICYAFQEPALIPSVSILKNVMLPLQNIMNVKAAQDLTELWLKKLNIFHKKDSLPSLLSGGERQRAGISRVFAWACAQKDIPCLLLLDEPFASQDEENTNNIISLIKEQINNPFTAALVISHDQRLLNEVCTSSFLRL